MGVRQKCISCEDVEVALIFLHFAFLASLREKWRDLQNCRAPSTELSFRW